jgi:predicted ATP-grasp superfamily ATP-dependent carboligase
VVRAREDHRLAALSRYSAREIVFQGADDDSRHDQLEDLARRHGLSGWALYPTADATTAFVARRHAALGEHYRTTTPPWEVFRWGYDKRCTAELAGQLGVGQPWTRPIGSRAEVLAYRGPFPVVIKPATKPHLNRPATKAWPAENEVGLLRSFDTAATEAESSTLVLQEFIPGHAHSQLSFAALCAAGDALVRVTAERVRQHPPDFGRSSTFVQTVDDPEVEDAGERILKRIGLTGLAEVEFKRDARDGALRLLDINLRVWGWHTIGRRHGADFPYLAWRLVRGRSVEERRVPSGLRWRRLTTDLAAGTRLITSGDLSAGGYLRSTLGPHERAIAASDDPLPGLAELPAFAVSAFARRIRRAVAP